MLKLAILLIVVLVKTVLCKVLAFAIFLLMFWIKGKKLEFNSERWDNFFLQMLPQTIQRHVITIYLTAAVLSSVLSYFILEAASYQYSLTIAILLFVGGLAVTAYRWHTKGKAYLLKRYQEIPQTILS